VRYFDKDVFDRLAAVEEVIESGRSALTEYFYDARGKLVEILDADENSTRIERDWQGQRTRITRAGRSWEYAYDANGNLVAETSPVPTGASAGAYATLFEYDVLDRIVRRTPAARDLTEARRAELGVGPVDYFYDGEVGPAVNAIGRLSAVALPFGSVSYGYDLQGNQTLEERSVVAGPVATTQWVARQYNVAGQPTRVEHDDGSVSERSYDERGLPLQVRWFDPRSASWAIVAEYDRSQAGQIVERRTSFGQRRRYSYDAVGRPSTDEIEGGGLVQASRRYHYDGVGDLIQVEGANAGESAAAVYDYDGLHRLRTASGPAGYAAALAYSAAGNVANARVAWGGEPQRDVRYRYGALDPQAVDRLTGRDGSVEASFAYDLTGNMVRREARDGILNLTWDGEDQLREAVGSAGSEVYVYDHARTRVLALDGQGARLWFGASETHFDASGREIRRRIHIGDGGGALARVERVAEPQRGGKAGKGGKRRKGGSEPAPSLTIELQYSDALRNLMLTLDETGAMTASFLYGAFGEVVSEAGGAEHRRQFNGKEHDVLTGLRYYGFRYYDPLTLRWNSADPKYGFAPDAAWDEPQRMNLYAFSLNNPLRFFDPDGRDSDDNILTGLGLSLAAKSMNLNNHNSFAKMSEPRPPSVIERAALELVFPTERTGVDWGKVEINRGFVGESLGYDGYATGNTINVKSEYDTKSLAWQLGLIVHEGTHIVQLQNGVDSGLSVNVASWMGDDPYVIPEAARNIDDLTNESTATAAEQTLEFLLGLGGDDDQGGIGIPFYTTSNVDGEAAAMIIEDFLRKNEAILDGARAAQKQ
jgi:RHS repeat-associated protein